MQGLLQSLVAGVFAEHATSGALFLCGGSELPPEIYDEFLRLAGGERARLVHVPSASVDYDAAGEDERAQYVLPWQQRRWLKLDVLHAIDRAAAIQPDFAAPLATATGVWIGGGDQNRLAALYGDSEFTPLLPGVLARGGAIGGTSAGASAMSRVMIRGGGTQAKLGRGLGVLEQAIVDQHFTQRKRLHRLMHALEAHPELLGIGVDEKTALVIEPQRVRVLGKGTATLCRRHAPGEFSVFRLMSGEQRQVERSRAC
jgi:cyanophycinase